MFVQKMTLPVIVTLSLNTLVTLATLRYCLLITRSDRILGADVARIKPVPRGVATPKFSRTGKQKQ